MNVTVQTVLLNERSNVKSAIAAGEAGISELFSQIAAADRDLWRLRQRLIDLEVFITAKHNGVNPDVELRSAAVVLSNVGINEIDALKLPTCKTLDDFLAVNSSACSVAGHHTCP